MDFTLKTYYSLLNTLLRQGFSFQTFSDFIEFPHSNKVIILRHDIDRSPKNALKIARIENKLKISASYYFRIKPQSFNENIIKAISELGHEIGYHYEELSITKGDTEKAYYLFLNNLDKFRKIYPVKTICMHGSPMSKYDSRIIWKKYDYKKLGIIGEPYFDIDFDKVFYLTDTGRMWDGWKYSIRDKLPQQEIWILQGLTFHRTYDIISVINSEKIPDIVLITTHPQRWTNNFFQWLFELFWQYLKNIIKKIKIDLSI